jgi:magnesium-dependent phosphatase-1
LELSSQEPWALLLDLDGTLWDHLNISSLKPPFKRVSEDAIVDSRGVTVRLYKDIVEVARWAKRSGGFVIALSWNIPEVAVEALKAFNLLGLFDYLGIEDHPDKGLIASKILGDLESRGYKIKPCRIVYVDDRDIHVKGVREKVGDVTFIRAWADFRNGEELRSRIAEALQRRC